MFGEDNSSDWSVRRLVTWNVCVCKILILIVFIIDTKIENWSRSLTEMLGSCYSKVTANVTFSEIVTLLQASLRTINAVVFLSAWLALDLFSFHDRVC